MRPDMAKLIDKKADEIAAKKSKAEEIERHKLRMAEKSCEALFKNIRDLIETANYVRDKGIELPKSRVMCGYGYDYDSCAEGFYHGVGFIKAGKGIPIRYVGIINGGACGDWDLYASERGFSMIHEKTGEVKQPHRFALERFAEEFPKFESAFYQWIEDGMK